MPPHTRLLRGLVLAATLPPGTRRARAFLGYGERFIEIGHFDRLGSRTVDQIYLDLAARSWDRRPRRGDQ